MKRQPSQEGPSTGNGALLVSESDSDIQLSITHKQRKGRRFESPSHPYQKKSGHEYHVAAFFMPESSTGRYS